MRAVSLLYHDVIDGPDFDASGRPGAAQATFKLGLRSFESHLRAIRAAAPSPAPAVGELPERGDDDDPLPVLLTFDDGGSSACSLVAPLLDRLGWVGHFFVVSSYVGRDGFLDEEEIRELRRRGHVIGSHSATHPMRMAELSVDDLEREWRASVRRLSEILQEPVRVGSVPGGYYGPHVARAAAAAGIRTLFTSEPRLRSWRVGECCVLGRYAIRRDTPSSEAADLVRSRWSRNRQRIVWDAKKVAKRLGGRVYLRLREQLLR